MTDWLNELKQEAAKKLDVNVEDVQWYSWPVCFGSTAGNSGAGGQMMSGSQAYGFEAPAATDKAIKYSGGIWQRWSGGFR